MNVRLGVCMVYGDSVCISYRVEFQLVSPVPSHSSFLSKPMLTKGSEYLVCMIVVVHSAISYYSLLLTKQPLFTNTTRLETNMKF